MQFMTVAFGFFYCLEQSSYDFSILSLILNRFLIWQCRPEEWWDVELVQSHEISGPTELPSSGPLPAPPGLGAIGLTDWGSFITQIHWFSRGWSHMKLGRRNKGEGKRLRSGVGFSDLNVDVIPDNPKPYFQGKSSWGTTRFGFSDYSVLSLPWSGGASGSKTFIYHLFICQFLYWVSPQLIITICAFYSLNSCKKNIGKMHVPLLFSFSQFRAYLDSAVPNWTGLVCWAKVMLLVTENFLLDEQ